MRGHLRKRAAGKVLRRRRRRLFSQKQELMPKPALSRIKLIKEKPTKLTKQKALRPLARLGSHIRKVSRAGGLSYNNVIYKSCLGRLWNFRYLSVLDGLRKYFFIKTVRSVQRSRTKRYFRKKKKRLPSRPKEVSERFEDLRLRADSLRSSTPIYNNAPL